MMIKKSLSFFGTKIGRQFCASSSTGNDTLFHPKSGVEEVTLLEKIPLNHDSFVIRCAFSQDKTLGVPLGQHLRVHFEDRDPDNGRTYTPISNLNAKGYFDLLVKVYKPNDQFPKGGKLTQWLDTVKVGDIIGVSGPRGKFTLTHQPEELQVQFHRLDIERSYKKISFIAGGSGITPVYQLLMNLPEEDKVKYTVIYANKTEDDILLRHNLEKMEQANPNIKLAFTVEDPAAKGSVSPNGKSIDYSGYVNVNMIRETLPDPDTEDHLIYLAGNASMNMYLRNILMDEGYDPSCIFLY